MLISSHVHVPFSILYLIFFPLNYSQSILIREFIRPKVIKYLKVKIRLKQLFHGENRLNTRQRKNPNFRIHPQYLRYCYYIVRRYTDRKQMAYCLQNIQRLVRSVAATQMCSLVLKPQSEISLRTTLKIKRKVLTDA